MARTSERVITALAPEGLAGRVDRWDLRSAGIVEAVALGRAHISKSRSARTTSRAMRTMSPSACASLPAKHKTLTLQRPSPR